MTPVRQLTRIPLTIFLAALGAAASGIAMTPGTASAVLRINATTPTRYALNVPVIPGEIWATFNQPLSPLPDGCVRVAGTMSGLHDGSIIRMDNVIRFVNGTEAFFPGEMVVVNYRSDIQGTGGETLVGGFCFAFTIAAGPASALWSAPMTYPASDVPYFIYGGDLDEDSTPDVAAPNEGTNDVSVFLNGYGVGTFPTHEEYGVGEVPSSVFGEDFDNDGDQDLATADIAGGSITVLLNHGDGTFAPGQSYAAGSRCRQIHGGDFDGDNDVDLCATAYDVDRLHIYYNNGNGTYTPAAPITTISDGPFAIRTGDFNLDGHLDIGVACQNADALDIFMNTGAGAFTRTGTYAIGNGPWCLNGNDMDADGDFDLVSVASFSDQLVVLFNNGSGAFNVRHVAGTADFPLGVFAADLDGDGDIDATSSNFNGGTVGVYMNPGNGQVALQSTLDVQSSGSYTWAHDLDSDGDLDLSVVDENADLLFVFYNGPVPADVESGAGPFGGSAAAASAGKLLVHPNPIDSGSGAVVTVCGAGAAIDLDLVGVDGRLLRRVWSGMPSPEGARIVWDGRDARGVTLRAGHYILLARTQGGVRTAARSVVVLAR